MKIYRIRKIVSARDNNDRYARYYHIYISFPSLVFFSLSFFFPSVCLFFFFNHVTFHASYIHSFAPRGPRIDRNSRSKLARNCLAFKRNHTVHDYTFRIHACAENTIPFYLYLGQYNYCFLYCKMICYVKVKRIRCPGKGIREPSFPFSFFFIFFSSFLLFASR